MDRNRTRQREAACKLPVYEDNKTKQFVALKLRFLNGQMENKTVGEMRI